MAHRAQNSVGLFLAKQKLRQLGDIRRDPPRLVAGEQVCAIRWTTWKIMSIARRDWATVGYST
jgi:hypothetical protein